jgi:hypothetical protein
VTECLARFEHFLMRGQIPNIAIGGSLAQFCGGATRPNFTTVTIALRLLRLLPKTVRDFPNPLRGVLLVFREPGALGLREALVHRS